MTSPKTALITGASSGFGLATAHALAEQGFRLILVARRLERLENIQRELDVECRVQQLDMRDTGAIIQFVEKLPAEFRDIDVLVNNAGLALGTAPAHETDLDDWVNMIDTNITGLVTLTRQLLPAMVERHQGLIINIGSIAGDWPYPGGNVYGATKAFVHQFSNGLRADLLGTGIRVSCLQPGLAETEFSIVRFKGDEQKASNLYEGTQPITPSDIAETIRWLVSVPPHLNINHVEIMPVCQAWGALAVDRSKG